MSAQRQDPAELVATVLAVAALVLVVYDSLVADVIPPAFEDVPFALVALALSVTLFRRHGTGDDRMNVATALFAFGGLLLLLGVAVPSVSLFGNLALVLAVVVYIYATL